MRLRQTLSLPLPPPLLFSVLSRHLTSLVVGKQGAWRRRSGFPLVSLSFRRIAEPPCSRSWSRKGLLTRHSSPPLRALPCPALPCPAPLPPSLRFRDFPSTANLPRACGISGKTDRRTDGHTQYEPCNCNANVKCDGRGIRHPRENLGRISQDR